MRVDGDGLNVEFHEASVLLFSSAAGDLSRKVVVNGECVYKDS